MKPVLILIVFLIFVLSCDQKKISGDQQLRNEAIEHVVKSLPESKNHAVIEIKTATGKSFRISTDKKSASLNNISVLPQGFLHTKDTFQIKDADPLTDAFTMDLNQDGFDELYLLTRAAGSGSYTSIFAFSSNKDKSVSPVYIAKISEADLKPKGVFYGYMGHDSVFVSNEQLFRKYPVYKEGDENCCPTGGERILAYTLEAGEASWQLNIKK